MPTQPITQSSFPRAILHFGGDTFFASVEQAVAPRLKGLPVVTGKEQGIITSASFEAKGLGLERGMSLEGATTSCLDLVVVPTDYQGYRQIANRVLDLVQGYAPIVEEEGLGEGFADLSGLRRICRDSFKEIPSQIQQAVQHELGINLPMGMSLSKSLAKLASSYRKPFGYTALPGYSIHWFLEGTLLQNVWRLDRHAVQGLQRAGLKTAYDFISRPEKWVDKVLGKPGRDIWNELRGRVVFEMKPVEPATVTTHRPFSLIQGGVEGMGCRLEHPAGMPRLVA